MAAYRRVYDSRHMQADCQEPGSAPEPYTLGNRVYGLLLPFLLGADICPGCYHGDPPCGSAKVFTQLQTDPNSNININPANPILTVTDTELI